MNTEQTRGINMGKKLDKHIKPVYPLSRLMEYVVLPNMLKVVVKNIPSDVIKHTIIHTTHRWFLICLSLMYGIS